MRLFFKIAIYMMLLVLLTAEDCGDSHSESEAEVSETSLFQELESNFVSDELDAEVLTAFEKRGIQKLSDVVDYMNIYADSSLDVQFRSQSKQLIRKAFISKNEVRKYYENLELFEDTTNLILLKTDKIIKRIELKSVMVSKEFYAESISRYIGELNYLLLVRHNSTGNSVEEDSLKCSLNIVAVKTSKNFGQEALDVWELFLVEGE